jgi:flagellar biosynthesis protein FlhB
LKYNYPETKDLCKQFLTLVVAVLVFSLTLSEKFGQFNQASLPAKFFVVVAWSSMLVSVIFCGVGLTYITLAAGDAVYRKVHYLRFAAKSYNCIVVAGMCFIIGLILLIVTAVVSVTASD